MFLDVFSKNPGQNDDTATTPTTPITPAAYTLTVTVSPAEGGSVSRNPNADSYNAGTRVTVAATPNNGYEFLGWTGALNSNDSSVTVTMDGNNKTLSAGFRKIGANLPKYTVYFNANGATGAPPESIQRDSGSVVSLPDLAGLTKDWHSFAGWNTEADGSGRNYDAFENYVVANTVTLFARWTRNTYALTVNAAIGGTTLRSPNQAKYDAGTQVTVTAAPSEHFTFTGWSGASNATTPTVTITMDDNKELTPVFTQNTYTLTTNISIDGGGTVSRNPNANSYAPGTEVTVTATAATAQGYTFSGWSGASTSANSTVTITMDGDKTLTAGFGKRDATKFTVTFNRNGATVGSVEAVTADSGATITLPGQGSLERSGYSFAEWSINANGTGTKYGAEQTYTVTKDVTLFARWIPKYNVTFSDNGATGGSAPQAITADSGSVVAMPVQGNLAKTGHTFDGWNTKSDGTGTGYGVGQTYTVTSNVTLYAKWTAINCTVTFNGNGATGGIPSAMNAAYGGSITLPSMTRTKYNFGGWNTNSSGTGTDYGAGTSYSVIGNVTLYAKWMAYPVYSVIYDKNGATSNILSEPGLYVDSGFIITLPGQGTMTKVGYNFGGWNTNSSGTGTDYDAGAFYSVMGNVTLYAKWTLITGGTNCTSLETCKTVRIGGQLWLKENLNVVTSESWCNGDNPDNCAKYGRLYTWNMAKSACQSLGGNWHLPTREEWDELSDFATELKSTNGWYDYYGNDSGNGTDKYGFSALPGGYYHGGSFGNAGLNGVWWTATEGGSSNAYSRYMGYFSDYVFENYDDKGGGFSVRCRGD
jgi:uncharacterized protein (TIGR02145 family)/uncharacterized repeat protein (TIGR02543 family)